jgi:hypothetical protein
MATRRLPEPRTPRVSDSQHRTTGREIRQIWPVRRRGPTSGCSPSQATSTGISGTPRRHPSRRAAVGGGSPAGDPVGQDAAMADEDVTCRRCGQPIEHGQLTGNAGRWWGGGKLGWLSGPRQARDLVLRGGIAGGVAGGRRSRAGLPLRVVPVGLVPVRRELSVAVQRSSATDCPNRVHPARSAGSAELRPRRAADLARQAWWPDVALLTIASALDRHLGVVRTIESPARAGTPAPLPLRVQSRRSV